MNIMKKMLAKQLIKNMAKHLKESTDDSVLRGYVEASNDYKRNPNEDLKVVVSVIGEELVSRGFNLDEIKEGNGC